MLYYFRERENIVFKYLIIYSVDELFYLKNKIKKNCGLRYYEKYKSEYLPYLIVPKEDCNIDETKVCFKETKLTELITNFIELKNVDLLDVLLDDNYVSDNIFEETTAMKNFEIKEARISNNDLKTIIHVPQYSQLVKLEKMNQDRKLDSEFIDDVRNAISIVLLKRMDIDALKKDLSILNNDKSFVKKL